ARAALWAARRWIASSVRASQRWRAPPRGGARRAPSGALHRVRHVDELDVDAEALRHVLAERAHAQALGGVVACRQVDDAGLAREVRHPLARLAGDEGVEALRDGLVELRLRAAAD